MTGAGFTIIASEVRIDCTRHAYKYVSGKSYDRSGNLLQSAIPRAINWTRTAAGSATKQIESFVCEGGLDHPKFLRASPADAARPIVVFGDGSASPSAGRTGGWSFAHWGMTKPEVRAASKGATHPADSSDYRDDVDGEVAIGPYKFAVAFNYTSGNDDGVLHDIVFSLQGSPSRCRELRRYLKRAETLWREGAGPAPECIRPSRVDG